MLTNRYITVISLGHNAGTFCPSEASIAIELLTSSLRFPRAFLAHSSLLQGAKIAKREANYPIRV